MRAPRKTRGRATGAGSFARSRAARSPARGTSAIRYMDGPRDLIGVGRPHWFAAPLPPNRTGGSPASGSPVDGSPSRGLTRRRMGCFQTVQPLLGKERIRPTPMVISVPVALSALTLAQDTPQTHPDPT